MRLGLGDETGHHVEWAVAFDDLRQSVLDAHGQTIRCRGHIAVGQCVLQRGIDARKFTAQFMGEPTLPGLDDGTRMIGHETAQGIAGALDVPEIAGTVERMKARSGKRGRVADVMQPGSGLDQVSGVSEDGGKRPCPGGDASRMRPAAGQWLPQERTGDFFGTLCLLSHAAYARRPASDVHGRGVPSRDVLGRSARWKPTTVGKVLAPRLPFRPGARVAVTSRPASSSADGPGARSGPARPGQIRSQDLRNGFQVYCSPDGDWM